MHLLVKLDDIFPTISVNNMNLITNLTIGADPELFFVEARTNIPRSAEGLLGGDKQHPVQMEGLPEGFMIQEDNAAAEFNIPPAKTVNQFTTSIFSSLKYLSAIAKKNKLKLSITPDLDFTKEQLATKHCQTLGCNPDFNAWIEEENPVPQPPELMRTAAGHIHIGWSKPTWDQIIWVARGFDLLITVPSILVTKPNRRRTLYGKAGACRPKKYGVECRSVDNFWLTKRAYQQRIFENVHFLAAELNNNGDMFTELMMDYAGMVIDCINNHDVGLATFLCSKFNIPTF